MEVHCFPRSSQRESCYSSRLVSYTAGQVYRIHIYVVIASPCLGMMPPCLGMLPPCLGMLPPCLPFYLLIVALPMYLLLAKQIARQVAHAQVESKATCMCTGRIKGNLHVHRQNHRQVADAHAEAQAVCLGTGRITGSSPGHRQNHRQFA